MSNSVDISFVRENYERASDSEILRIATQDAYGLTPEAREILITELRKRNLDPNAIKAIEAQNKSYSLDQIDAYCDIIQKLPCPKCGNIHSKLNATITGEVVSFIIFTQHTKKIIVGCPNCLDRANNDALTKTATLGWWGFPWGIIKSIQYINLNMKSQKTNHQSEPTEYLRSYVLGKIGEIEAYKGDNKKLAQILKD